MSDTKSMRLWDTIPGDVRKTLLRIVLVFGGWLLLYNLILKPAGIPDRQFTDGVAWATDHVLGWFIDDIELVGRSIFIQGVQSVNIANPCNGLELIALYIGILICIPGSLKRKLLFILGGSLGIMILNVARCSILAWMFYQQAPLADFAHHYAFKLIIYLFTFASWYLFSRKGIAK